MDIKDAVRMLDEMETWVTEAGLRILDEKEEADRSHSAVYLAFLSQVENDGIVADVITSFIYEHEMVMLCIRFHKDIASAKMRELMEVVNLLNFANLGTFWIVFEDDDLVECRTTLRLGSFKMRREEFMKALTDIVDCGYAEYAYIRRLIDEDDSFLSVKADIMREMDLESSTNQGTEKMGIC